MGLLGAPFGIVALFTGAVLDRDARRRVVWLGLGVGVILHAFYVIAYTDHYTFWAWYYVSAVIAAGLTSYWVEWIAGRTAKFVPENIAYALASMAIILLLSLGAARAWLKGIGPIGLGPVVIDVQINSYRWPDEVAQWMKTNLPPGSAVYAFDYPGAIAFYSDLRVLPMDGLVKPMDGLVNDYEYNEELLALGVNRYLCEHSIDYYFGVLEYDQATQIVPVQAPLSRQPAGSLHLPQEDIVVRTRDIVAIWNLRCPASQGQAFED
jgi:MFS family permease